MFRCGPDGRWLVLVVGAAMLVPDAAPAADPLVPVVSLPPTMVPGQWVDTTVLRPVAPATRLRWVSGGWATDARTGQTFWRLPGLRPVRIQRPAAVELQRTWQPAAPASWQSPPPTFVPSSPSDAAPAQATRYLDEPQPRAVRLRECRLVEPRSTEITALPPPGALVPMASPPVMAGDLIPVVKPRQGLANHLAN